MEQFDVRQGDQYAIPFTVIMDGRVITENLVRSPDSSKNGDVEITVGKFVKTLNANEVVFNKMTNTFDFPLTQQETFSLKPGMRLKSQIRVKLKSFNANENNLIFSQDGPDIVILKSLSTHNI